MLSPLQPLFASIMATKHERAAQWQDDLLPHIVDRLVRETPGVQYAEWVTGSGVVPITYGQLANIVNGLAWWLVEQLGGPGDHGSNPEVLTYVGTNDVRYSALVLAAAKAGYVVRVFSLPLSSRSTLLTAGWFSALRNIAQKQPGRTSHLV